MECTGEGRSAERPKASSANRAALALFATTLFLSALLLFAIQPIYAKMVLPQLGGTPAVWAVSLCFFQAVLLAGYCYAHLLHRFCSHRWALLTHMALVGGAVFSLPFGPPAGAEAPTGDLYFWLLGVLAAGVGLPFFAVSANAPLLQSWFTRSGHPHAADPYFLYGASNLGSLIALVSYPVVLEPILRLSTQSHIWTGGFLLLALLIAACGALVTADKFSSPAEAGERAAAPPPTSWSLRLRWMGLAFVPSGLLVAFTSYLTTDIASAPFLWVIPLALFLTTFVFVFRDRPTIPHRLLLIAQPLLVVGALLGLSIPGDSGWALVATAGFGAFFVTAMVCHKELYDARPDRSRLTEFYMWMSLGGVLGGMFAAILAPQLFNAIYEFPILLIFGLACRPGFAMAIADRDEVLAGGRAPLALLMVVAALALGLAVTGAPDIARKSLVLLPLSVISWLMIRTRERPFRLLAYAAVAGLTLVLLPTALSHGHAERSFFGVHRVLLTDDGSLRMMMHGTTLHGVQRIRDWNGNLVKDPVPATYYHPEGPLARGVAVARQVSAKPAGGLRVGIIGLGAGSMSCYSRGDETWRFYEIDPVVVKIARDERLFTFLSRCQPRADILLGDARLTLAKEADGRLDYLVVDAFSSDAIPVHLLTREAIAMYLDKLGPDGILALHISNRHLHLPSVAGATALSVPGTLAAFVVDQPAPATDGEASNVMFVSRSRSALAPILAWPDAKPVTGAGTAPWSDDYSNIAAAIWRRYFH